jgi:hypothetical protein
MGIAVIAGQEDVASSIYSWVQGSRPSSSGASAGTVGDELEDRQHLDFFTSDIFGRLRVLFPQLQSEIPETPRDSPVLGDDAILTTEFA